MKMQRKWEGRRNITEETYEKTNNLKEENQRN